MLKIYNETIDNQLYRVPVHTLADGTTVVITYHTGNARQFSDGTKLHINFERSIKIADSHWISQLDIIDDWAKLFELKERVQELPKHYDVILPGENKAVAVTPYLTTKQITVLRALSDKYGIVMVQPSVVMAIQIMHELVSEELTELPGLENIDEFNTDSFNNVLAPTIIVEKGLKTIDLKRWRWSLVPTRPNE